MGKLKVGIIGLGVGEKHIPAFNRHPDCQVTSICDFSELKLTRMSECFPGILVTKRADDILDDPQIDIVSIASYDNYHFEQIKRAIRSGKHIFVEKPICLYRNEAVKIKGLLESSPEIKMSTNLSLRTCPMFNQVRDKIHTKKFGELFYMEADYLWGRVQKLIDGWRNKMDYYSIIHGAAVHMIDLTIWLTGKKPMEVFGYGNQIATKGSNLRYNDFASILLKFSDGMVAKISANSGCQHKHFHTLNVYGTKKTFLHNSFGSRYIEKENDDFNTIDASEGYPAFDEKGKIIYTFVDAIIHKKSKPLVSKTDVMDTMSVCFAAEKAIQTGSPVKITYI